MHFGRERATAHEEISTHHERALEDGAAVCFLKFVQYGKARIRLRRGYIVTLFKLELELCPSIRCRAERLHSHSSAAVLSVFEFCDLSQWQCIITSLYAHKIEYCTLWTRTR